MVVLPWGAQFISGSQTMLKCLWPLAVIASCQAGSGFAQETLIQERVVGFPKSEGHVDFDTVLIERLTAERPSPYKAHVVVSLWAVGSNACQILESSTIEAEDQDAEGNFHFTAAPELTSSSEWLPVVVLSSPPLAYSDNEIFLSQVLREDESLSDMRDIRVVRVVGAAHLLSPKPTTLIEVAFFDPLDDTQRVRVYKLDFLASQKLAVVLTGVGCP